MVETEMQITRTMKVAAEMVVPVAVPEVVLAEMVQEQLPAVAELEPEEILEVFPETIVLEQAVAGVPEEARKVTMGVMVVPEAVTRQVDLPVRARTE